MSRRDQRTHDLTTSPMIMEEEAEGRRLRLEHLESSSCLHLVWQIVWETSRGGNGVIGTETETGIETKETETEDEGHRGGRVIHTRRTGGIEKSGIGIETETER